LAFGLPPLLVGGATFGSGGFTSFGAPPDDELDEQPVMETVNPAKIAAKSSSRMGKYLEVKKSPGPRIERPRRTIES